MNISDPFCVSRDAPFHHLYTPAFLPADICSDVFDFFEATSKWHLPEGAAPGDGPIMLMNGKLPPGLAFLESPETFASLKGWLSGKYGVAFGDKCEVIGNKTAVGEGIKPHTDFHQTAPSHRIVIFITRDWSWNNGGELWLLKANGDRIARSGHLEYPPIAGDAVTFAISRASYHTVQATREGARYSLTYSFYPPR